MTEDRREEWVNTPQQARSQETLDRFLEATEQLLREKTFDEITIAEIVDRAGRTVGSFYARFDDKVAVVKTLAARRLAAMRYLSDEMLDPQTWKSYTVRELVETSMATLCDLYRTYGHVFRAGLIMATNDADGRKQRNRHYDHLGAQLCAALVAHPEVEPTAEPRIEFAAEVVGALMDSRLIFRRPEDPRSDADYWATTAQDISEVFLTVAELG